LNKGCLHEALSRVELADMLGVTQRTLIRSLKKLETERLVNMKRDAFIILDIDTLRQISHGI
jgi:DNA-binding MarR family transcriptional regulator